MGKPKLYILPRYIAPLKYFEKLVPDLRERFDVSFLLLEDKGMFAYLRGKGLPVIDCLLPRGDLRAPFVAHFRDHRRLVGNAHALFRAAKPAVILTETTISQPMRTVFAIAHEHGATVKALQWCQQINAYKGIRLSLRNRARQIVARHGGLMRGIVREAYFFALALLLRALSGAGILLAHSRMRHVDRLGVIDRFGADYFAQNDWDRARMATVGFFDWSMLRDMRVRISHDAVFRTSLERLYGLAPGRRRVLILSTIFYAGHAMLSMSANEQVSYFGSICDDIAAAYPDADILFKLHPRDKEIYGPLERKGVRLLKTEANVEELIMLSDLYIAHPLTAANFSVIGSGVPALFINFTTLSLLDMGYELYGLARIIKDRAQFRDALAEAAAGRLPLQYDETRADPQSREKILRFVSK